VDVNAEGGSAGEPLLRQPLSNDGDAMATNNALKSFFTVGFLEGVFLFGNRQIMHLPTGLVSVEPAIYIPVYVN